MTDRKVWTAIETRALIILKDEMKSKFQTMKRNRTLWVELSEKLRKRYGHDRTSSQCAVRWKNIMSAYKDSRESLRQPDGDRKVCSFFKEVEAVLGDPPISLPCGTNSEAVLRASGAPTEAARERKRERKEDSVLAMLAHISAKVEAQDARLARIELLLTRSCACRNLTTDAPHTPDADADAQPAELGRQFEAAPHADLLEADAEAHAAQNEEKIADDDAALQVAESAHDVGDAPEVVTGDASTCMAEEDVATPCPSEERKTKRVKVDFCYPSTS